MIPDPFSNRRSVRNLDSIAEAVKALGEISPNDPQVVKVLEEISNTRHFNFAGHRRIAAEALQKIRERAGE